MQALHSTSVLLWALEKFMMREPMLVLSLFLGTPENVGVT